MFMHYILQPDWSLLLHTRLSSSTVNKVELTGNITLQLSVVHEKEPTLSASFPGSHAPEREY